MHADDPVVDLMDRFTAALNSHDLDAVLALAAEDIVFESTTPPPDGARYERTVRGLMSFSSAGLG